MSTRQKQLAFVAVAAFFLLGPADWVSDMVFRPWARAEPPLLDQWVGGLTTGTGERLDMVLVLKRRTFTDGITCARCAQIEGTAATCDGRGVVRRYRIAGSPSDRSGHQLRLGASPAVTPPPDGLELDVVFGTWDGADTLMLQANFFWRRGISAISSTDDPATQPVPLRMRRKRADSPAGSCAKLAPEQP